jgi:hypothetical protein
MRDATLFSLYHSAMRRSHHSVLSTALVTWTSLRIILAACFALCARTLTCRNSVRPNGYNDLQPSRLLRVGTSGDTCRVCLGVALVAPICVALLPGSSLSRADAGGWRRFSPWLLEYCAGRFRGRAQRMPACAATIHPNPVLWAYASSASESVSPKSVAANFWIALMQNDSIAGGSGVQ